MNTTSQSIAGWEGLLDDQYDWSQNPPNWQAIGWGEYQFTVEINGEEKQFYLSTLDGNWLDQAYGDDNKIVFYVDFNQNTPQEAINIEIQVYEYKSQSWVTVGEDQRVTFWDLHGIARERDRIIALSEPTDVPFTIAYPWPDHPVTKYAVEVPFYNSTHHFDVNVVVLNRLEIPEGKTMVITDHEYEVDENITGYATTRWVFGENCKVDLRGGTFTTYSKDPLISFPANPRMGVELFPSTTNESDPRISWGGIVSTSLLDGPSTISLQDTWIMKAEFGALAYPDDVCTITRCWIDSCRTGILVDKAYFRATRDTIRDCNTGIKILETAVAAQGLDAVIDFCQIWRSVETV
jgi:hypothetical protein